MPSAATDDIGFAFLRLANYTDDSRKDDKLKNAAEAFSLPRPKFDKQ